MRRFFEAELAVPLQLEAETGKPFRVSDRACTVLDALMTAYVQRGGRVCTAARDRSAARGRLLDGAALVWRDDPRGAGHPGGRRALGACHRQRWRGSAHRVRARPRHRPHLSRARAADRQQSRLHRVWRGCRCGRGCGQWTKDPKTKERHSASVVRHSSLVSSHGGFLFTHRGYSWLAVLNVSHVVTR